MEEKKKSGKLTSFLLFITGLGFAIAMGIIVKANLGDKDIPVSETQWIKGVVRVIFEGDHMDPKSKRQEIEWVIEGYSNCFEFSNGNRYSYDLYSQKGVGNHVKKGDTVEVQVQQSYQSQLYGDVNNKVDCIPIMGVRAKGLEFYSVEDLNKLWKDNFWMRISMYLLAGIIAAGFSIYGLIGLLIKRKS